MQIEVNCTCGGFVKLMIHASKHAGGNRKFTSEICLNLLARCFDDFTTF